MLRPNTRDRLQAVHPRHGNIQQHHLTGRMTQGLEQLLAVAGFAHHLHVLGQADQLFDALADNRVVFGH